MSTRKKNTVLPLQGKYQLDSNVPGVPPSTLRTGCAASVDIETLLMIGQDHVLIEHEENDNIDFMGELIDH